MLRRLPSAATLVALLVTLAVATQTSFAASAPDTRAPKRVRLVDVSAADRTSVTVGWSPSRDNVGVAGYGVYVDGSNRGSTTERSFVLQQLVCGTGYLVGVDAFDAAGNRSPRNSTSVATDPCRDVSAPSAPVGVQQLATSDTSAVFGWLASTDDVGVVEYGLYVSALRVGNVSEATATVSNLACDTTYSLGIDAADAAGNRSARTPVFFETAPCVDRTAPSAPPNLQVGSATRTSVLVRWDSASDNVGVVTYRVYRNGSKIGEGPGVHGGFTNEWNDNARTCGTTYQYAVEALDAAGNTGPRTTLNAATAACGVSPTLPPPPTPPATPPTPPATPPTPPATPPTPPATPPTSPPQGGDRLAPSAPPNLQVGSATRTSVLVRWDSASDNVGVVTYRVYRNGSKIGEGPGVHGGFTNEWNDNARTCGTTYQYAVEALDAAGNTGPRTTLNAATAACGVSPTLPPPPTPPATPPTPPATPPTPPATPPTPPATPPTSPPQGGDRLAPSAPPNLQVGSATRTSVLVRWDSASDNVGVVTYRVYRNGSKIGEGPGVHGGFTNEWNDNARTCGTTYQYAVEALDAAGNTGPRTTLNAATAACGGSAPAPPAPPAGDTSPPSVPANVTASSRTATSIALTWSAATDNVGVAGYGLYKAGARVATTGGTTGIVSGLACNTNYTLAVDAVDAAGNRSQQAVVMVSTTACSDTQPPSTPTGLATSNVSQTALTLNWAAATDNIGVTGYDIYRGGTKIGYATGLSTSLTGLTCGTTYVLAVAARDAAGNQSSLAQLNRSTSNCAAAPPPPAPPTGVLEITGTVSGQEFSNRVNAAPAGALTVRPGGGQSSFAVSSDTAINRANVTVQKGTFEVLRIDPSADNVTVEDGSLNELYVAGGGVGNFTLQRNQLDGECRVAQNWIHGATNFRILNNTFRNYHVCADESIHSEALFIAAFNNGGLIEGNTFIDNGTTGHIFFSWFGGTAGVDHPRDICVRGNTFIRSHNSYYHIQYRAEIPASSGIRVEAPPSNSIDGSAGLGAEPFVRSC